MAVGTVPSPEAAPFLAYDTLHRRFREVRTPPRTRDPGSSGLGGVGPEQFVGVDYNADRASISTINRPVTAGYDATGKAVSTPYMMTSQTTVFNIPGIPDGTVVGTPPTGADGLVMVFGGWGRTPDVGTVAGGDDGQGGAVGGIAANAVRGKWDVLTIDWTAFTAADFRPALSRRPEYAANGYDLGYSLASWVRNQGFPYVRFHVVGYSMGAWAADGFADGLNALGLGGVDTPRPVHLTLLDAYVPNASAPSLFDYKLPGHTPTVRDQLGDKATWAEQYQDTSDIALAGEVNQFLPNVYNLEVHGLYDPATGLSNTSSDIPLPDSAGFLGHTWVPFWYQLTTNIGGDSTKFSRGWGYPVAPEFAGFSLSHDTYPRGGRRDLTYLTFTADPPPTAPVPNPLLPVSVTATGAGAGGGRVVGVGPDGAVVYDLAPFGPGHTGGVRVATADVTGDGTPDVIAGTGSGGPTRVVVLDGATQALLFDLAPFEASFTGGVYVAAGDLDGDGRANLVVTPDEGGGPRARVFRGKDFAQLADFFGINDPAFRGGARPALGDLDGDGAADLIVAAGFGGGPRVAAFSGARLAADGGRADQTADVWEAWKLCGDFLAFEPDLRNGTFVAAGDTTGDGRAELVAGGGPGGGPRVSVFAGADLLAGTQTRVADFFAGDLANRGGVRVAVKNLDGDARADVVTGAGDGAGSRVTAYAGATLAGGDPPSVYGLDAFAGFAGGVFVG